MNKFVGIIEETNSSCNDGADSLPVELEIAGLGFPTPAFVEQGQGRAGLSPQLHRLGSPFG